MIVERHGDAAPCRDALTAAGYPGGLHRRRRCVRLPAAADWLCLLEAFDAPHRSGLVRAAACTMFFGETAETLAAGGDDAHRRVAETLREWTDHARAARDRGGVRGRQAGRDGPAGAQSSAAASGTMTDLRAHRRNCCTRPRTASGSACRRLRDWLRKQCEDRTSGATERNRRLDSDAAAVQIMTVCAAKGLQFPIVYLPFAFNRTCRRRGRSCSTTTTAAPSALPVHRRQRRPGSGPRRAAPAVPRTPGRHPAHLCRADPGAVAGGGVVGAVPRRGQRRAVPAAARPLARRDRGADRCAPKITDDDALGAVREVGGRRRPGGRGLR